MKCFHPSDLDVTLTDDIVCSKCGAEVRLIIENYQSEVLRLRTLCLAAMESVQRAREAAGEDAMNCSDYERLSALYDELRRVAAEHKEKL